ncbi:MAG: adenylyltransferase/cytidyltransferase family protein, partial [Deltaproteobacteria bacterium]|nr:adenylyltransferase/cytidyltransferase family protein [Deltaproteobacteria bacterium]
MGKKIIERAELKKTVQTLKNAGKKIVFTNGCFDLLHLGHVRYLEAARAEGDVLVVGVNSDRSVHEIKGPSRPVVPDDERAEVLAALACVDFITLFDEPNPLETIRALLPDVLVKGSDWAEDAIVGK